MKENRNTKEVQKNIPQLDTDIQKREKWNETGEWARIKEIVGMGATISAAVYVISLYLVYMYWKGYFATLKINEGFLTLDIKQNIAEFAFSSIFLATYLIIMGFVWNWFGFGKKKKIYREKGATIFILCLKTFCFMFATTIFSTFLVISNSGLIQIRMIMKTTLILMGFGIPVGIIGAYICRLMRGDTLHREDSWHYQLFQGIPWVVVFTIAAIMIFLCYFTTIAYQAGTQKIKNDSIIYLSLDEEYMITYNTGSQYILHKISKDESGFIIIYPDQQKVVGNEEYEYVVKTATHIIIDGEENIVSPQERNQAKVFLSTMRTIAGKPIDMYRHLSKIIYRLARGSCKIIKMSIVTQF